MSGNKKFQDIWVSATDLGRLFGMSAIAVNKALASAGLRDPASKAPTEQALAQGWALATPLKDGTPHYMWDKRKAKKILGKRVSPLPPEEVALEAALRAILRAEREAEETGSDKFLYLVVDEELGLVRGTAPEIVASVCERLNIRTRIEEMQKLISHIELPSSKPKI